jgi:hypothetical protein
MEDAASLASAFRGTAGAFILPPSEFLRGPGRLGQAEATRYECCAAGLSTRSRLISIRGAIPL